MKRRTLLIAAAVTPLSFAQPRQRTMLAVPTPEILQAIKDLAIPVVELGSGNGYWLRALHDVGVDAIGYDPVPRGDEVLVGDHRDAAKHPDRALLIVWPPDETDVSEWVEQYSGRYVILCSDGNLFFRKAEGLGFKILRNMMTTGYAGPSAVIIYERADGE